MKNEKALRENEIKRLSLKLKSLDWANGYEQGKKDEYESILKLMRGYFFDIDELNLKQAKRCLIEIIKECRELNKK